MPAKIVLNELACVKMRDEVEARRCMSQLLQTYIALKQKLRERPEVHTNQDINHTELAESYPVSKWRNDASVSKEERTLLTGLITRWPLFVADEQLRDESGRYELSVYETNAVGFLFAHLCGGISISFDCSENWRSAHIDGEISRLDERNGEIASQKIVLRHVSCPDHAHEHEDWIDRQNLFDFYDGKDLWERRELFENLVFCEAVEFELSRLGHGDPKLNQIAQKLIQFNSYEWRNDDLALRGLGFHVSPDSQATLQQFAEERTHTTPGGRTMTFSMHARITPEAWRIYFDGDRMNNKFVIGYIGPHLRTVTG